MRKVSGLGASNSVARPDKPQQYYSLVNVAERNVIQLNGYVGWWDDEAVWLKNYLRDHEGQDVEIVITSQGGDVFTGQNMYNAIKAHKGTVTAYVQQAFSIAGHIAMAADVVNIVKGSQMMIHAVTGYCTGTAADMIAYAGLIENSGQAIAQSYVDKTGIEISNWLDAMSTTAGKYYSADECVELGLADAVIEASSMTNFVPEHAHEDEEEEEPKEPETNNHNDSGLTNNENLEGNTMDELQRQSAIRNLFNMLHARLGLPFELLNAALDNESTTVEQATQSFSSYTPDQGEGQPQSGVTFNHNPANNAGGNGSDAKIMVRNVLLNRAGYCELDAEHKPYAGMDLQNAARSLGVQGFGTAIAENALSSEDFKSVIGEITQEIVKQEATNNTSKVKELCQVVKKNRLGEYGVTDHHQIDGFGERESDGEFPQNNFTGEPKRKGNIVERGSQVLLTRSAILNDNFHVFATMPKDHVFAAYRAADKLMYERLVAYATKNGLTSGSLSALITAMELELKNAVTSNDDDLYYTGGLIMSNPTNMSLIKPILNTKTLSVDVLNPAFGAFAKTDTATRLGDWVLGFADGQKPLELAVLQGKEQPELIENTAINAANGIGWSVVWDFDVQVSNVKALTMGKVELAKSTK